MIEQMKKVSVLALDSRRAEVVSQLRELGVFHLTISTQENDSLAELREQYSTLERGLSLLPRERPDSVEGEAPGYSRDGALVLARYLSDIAEHRRELEDQLDQLLRDEQRLLPWGDVDPRDLEKVAERGIEVELYVLPQKQFRNVDAKRLFVCARRSNLVYFAVIYKEGEEKLDLTPVTLPERSLSDTRAKIDEKRRELEEATRSLLRRQPERVNLEHALVETDDKIRFEEVRVGMQSDEALAYLTGFVPADSVDSVRAAARSHGWGLVVQDPGPDEPVPTLVKRKKPVRIIEPIFDLMDTTPGYREVDISFAFLLFFTLFVAVIIGDAGYGVLILAGSIYAMVRGKQRLGAPTKLSVLLTVLSTATVIWGSLTGTWFGHEPIGELPFFAFMKVEAISSFNQESSRLIQWGCFVLATIQLSIAHLWKFIVELKRGRPRIKAFADLGWLIMMPGLYFMVLTVVLGMPQQEFALYAIAVGLVIVLAFSQQSEDAGFIKGVGRGLANIFPTALDGISSFADLISYIRLFAVGLATVEIARSFNVMASGIGDGVVGIVGGVLILFVGHTLNLIMVALAVVVHGVRLNMLEFARHIGMEWTGIPYRPFRRRAQAS